MLAELKSTLMVLLEIPLALLLVLVSLERVWEVCWWLYFFPWDLVFPLCRVYGRYHCYGACERDWLHAFVVGE